MKNIKVKDFLSEKELSMVREDVEQMFYESFKFDGLVSEEILKPIKDVYGEVGLDLVSRKFAENEFLKAVDMTLVDWNEYFGENESVVINKWKMIEAKEKLNSILKRGNTFYLRVNKPNLIGTLVTELIPVEQKGCSCGSAWRSSDVHLIQIGAEDTFRLVKELGERNIIVYDERQGRYI